MSRGTLASNQDPPVCHTGEGRAAGAARCLGACVATFDKWMAECADDAKNESPCGEMVHVQKL